MQQLDDETLQWRGLAPVAPNFDDVYYSADNGLEETRHVFLKGINAPDVWYETGLYTIAETGFGTGLNFLVTWQEWLDSNQEGYLTFISTEAFPLSSKALEKAHATFPEIEPLAAQLRAAWPPPSKGYHYREFAGGKIRLILLFGDVLDTLPSLHARVDAWFLDGFAPSKNPEMWSDGVLDQIARLSKTGTCFATFTAAGFVKRGLLARGFDIRKAPGYGRKRERLLGYIAGHKTSQPVKIPLEWASLPPPASSPIKSALVIGAGIAGASIASSLHRRGIKVSVIGGIEETASHVPAAILAPAFQRAEDALQLFVRSAFAHACCFEPYDAAWGKAKGVYFDSSNSEDVDKLHSVVDFINWPDDWIEKQTNGFFLKKSGSLDSITALTALLKGIDTYSATVKALHKTPEGWQAHLEGQTLTADCLIVAAGANTSKLLGAEHDIPPRFRAGQCEIFKAGTNGLPAENRTFGGYVTGETQQGIQTIGSTFEPLNHEIEALPPATNNSKQKILHAFEQHYKGAPDMQGHISSWKGLRLTSIDHRPTVGPVPDWAKAKEQFKILAKDAKIRGLGDMPYIQGLYMMTAFSSKGYQLAPYAAAYLTALILDDPLPIPAEMIPILHPARHAIKHIIRGKEDAQQT